MFRFTGLRVSRALSSLAAEPLPVTQARVVIVGGGIIGLSTAYHLAKAGWKDVVVLERNRLTSGTTWHAAGLMVTFGSTSETSTELRKYTKHLYASLEAETGQATGFMPVGFIELATNADRVEEFRRVAALNRRCGIDVHEIGPADVEKLFPLCRVDDVERGFYVPTDGRVNPVDASMALAKGARMHGARILEDVPVTGITKAGDRVTGVTTARGDIKAEFVVNCAGMWARQFAEKAGVTVANQAAEHYYLVTDAIPEIRADWPVIEDPSSYTYIRPEGAGLMVGLFETKAAAWNVKEIPGDFSFGEIEPDWERMTPFVEKAMSRVPRASQVGIKKFFCGPESFTPDLQPIVGEAPELRNYFVAAGLNSIGILTGGGIGRLLSHWIMHGKPDMDVTGMNIDRLHPYQGNPAYRAARVVESLGKVYTLHYPGETHHTARGIKHSPFHARLVDQGAFFKDISGWEGTGFFAGKGEKPTDHPLGWGRRHWFKHWEAEHLACRAGAVAFDMSFMAKFLVQGRDAGALLNRLATSTVAGTPDRMTYTQFLNSDGKMEADVTVAQLADDVFMVVATDTMHQHVLAHLRRAVTAAGPACHAFVTDATGAYAMLSVQGPRAREVVQAVTSADLSNAAFPFRTFRDIDIGFARVRCSRMTYVGELGFELFVPAEHALHVHDVLFGSEAAAKCGLRPAGLSALGSLRLEKGYRDYGHDMDNTDTLLEVGLGFTADWTKPGGFVGDAVTKAQKDGPGLHKRLVQVLCKDPQPFMYHGEVIRRNGVVVGDVRMASYGHTLGGAVGLAHITHPEAAAGGVVTPAFLKEGEWTVEVAADRFPITATLRPLYDPTNARIHI